MCGYDLNFTYPQNGIFPTLLDPFASVSEDDSVLISIGRNPSVRSSSLMTSVAERYAARNGNVDFPRTLTKRDLEVREEKRLQWKRDLSGRANGTLDPFYGCFLFDEVLDYASNFTFPWSALSLSRG